MPIATDLKQNKLLLDTHVLLWLVSGVNVLSKEFLKKAETAAQHHRLYISVFSICEVAMLDAKKRINLEIDPLDWIKQSLNNHDIQIIPFSPKIAVESTRLPIIFHGDPADRALIASAHEEHAILISCDSKIIEYGKGKHITVFDPSK